MAEFSIVNLVASATTGTRLDLPAIAREFPICGYEPSRFPGLVFPISRPRASLLIFSSGKIICAGTRTVSDAKAAIGRAVSLLRAKGINIGHPKVSIQNIVSTGDLHGFIGLDDAAMTLERTIYEPEQFPGLILKWPEPKVVFLLFSSGRFVCAGARSEDDIKAAVEALEELLESKGLILRL